MGTAAIPITEDLRPILEEVRKDLLDFGMRNPLLNYRLLKARGVESVPVLASEVFQQLVTEGQELEFASAHRILKREQLLLADRESDAVATNTTWRQLPHEQQALWGSGDIPENTFAAIHGEKELETRLLATSYSARSSIEEQGVNTLFVALGMLSWSDPSSPGDVHRAPLILVPVELTRQSASDGFRLRYSGDDVSPNLCLIEYLKQFEIALEPSNENDDFDVEGYFDRFTSAVSSNPSWSIDRHSVVLGFFSFSKFLMYRDLDPATWSNPDAILKHELLSKLLGQKSFAGDSSVFTDGSYLDDHLSIKDCFHVVDADSTQTLALLDVASGKSMVIQGPPGTGKSQTIINLIAEALANKKTVLFVSEKQAALDVVKKRLDKINLGNPCLELHSNKAKKKEVINELKRTAGLDPFTTPPRAVDQAALLAMRDDLNRYCKAVNEPIGASREKPIDLFGLILPAVARLSEVDNPLLDLPECIEWNDIDTQLKRNLSKSLQERLSATGIPTAHPFWGSELRVVLPATKDRLRHACNESAAEATALSHFGQSLANLLGANQPTSPLSMIELRDIAIRLLGKPSLKRLDIEKEDWTTHHHSILRTIAAGRQLSQIRQRWVIHLRPEAWSINAILLRSEIQNLGGKWWRFLSSRWKSTEQSLKSLFVSPTTKTVQEYLEVVNAVQEADMCEQRLAEGESLVAGLYGAYWRSTESDWDLLENQLNAIRTVKHELATGKLPVWCLRYLTETADHSLLSQKTSSVTTALDSFSARRQATLDLLKISNENAGIATRTAMDKPLDEIASSWRVLSDNVNSIDTLAAYILVREECLASSLGALVELADRWEHAPQHLLDVFDYARTSCLLTAAFEQFPSLVHFDQKSHSDLVKKFRKLDDKALEWARGAVSNAHFAAIPKGSSGIGGLGYLYTMFERKTKFPSIRKLMSNAGLAIQALKPVFMMSPMSVANFLPPGTVNFDLVIFDEASQVRPADALGAIVRAKQAVVVGDSKQLPPTSFFDSLAATEDDDSDSIATTDIESILGLFCSREAHQRMLRWHYRSKHESLIEGSNHQFYDDRLVVFPSPDQRRDDLGLIYRKIQNAPYERARTRTNPTEAKIIAEAVMRHAKEQLQRVPEDRLTLGVAAFSVSQRDAILDQLEILRRTQPGYEEFFATPPHEPFFVKNLENIQGDERDVIFISVGYGRTAEGYLAMSFGPVNRDGGERRLNVLFSRARRRCEVFTTLSADDIELTPTSGSGLRALKHFLQYAEHGRLGLSTPVGKPPESPFEEQVFDALQHLPYPYEVHTQVGCAGFFIDMAVVDPNSPGRYLIGIECDGAAYHSARSARDRDRLRQAVLEGLGWQLHRIWSTAWFKNRNSEIERLVAAIQLAQTSPSSSPRGSVVDAAQSSEDVPDDVNEIPPIREGQTSNENVRPYEFCQLRISSLDTDLHLISTGQLVDWLAEVTSVESPIHWMEAGRRIADALGVQRLGNRIQEALIRACKEGSRAKKFLYHDDFLFNIGYAKCPIRSRSEFTPQTKKLEYVSCEEICAAVEHVVLTGFGVLPEEVPVATCRLLGFARVSEEMRSTVEECRDLLISRGRLAQRGEMLIHAKIN